MALTRKFLAALGIEGDKVDEIINAHTDVTDALKEERDRYKADAEKLPAVEDELNAFKEKAAGEDPYKEKFEKLQADFDAYKADVDAKAITAQKEKAFRQALLDIGIPEKRIDSVMKVSDLAKIELDKEGSIKEGDKLKEGLKTEWADFIATTKTEGAKTATPPTNTGKTTMTREQIRAIPDASERQRAMLENPSLFGMPETSNT